MQVYEDHIIGFTFSWFYISELPTDGEKKKYYNCPHHFLHFFCHNAAANNFQSLIDDYPVSSHTNSKESFLKWIHFIHNKINKQIGKEFH